MIEKTMLQAIRRELDDCGGIRIYVLKAGEHVLYVGQTWDHIAGRLDRHLSPGQWMHYYVRRCAPGSWQWRFELYTFEEAAALAELPYVSPESQRDHLDDVERELIRKLRPSVNVTYNHNGQELPEEIALRLIDLETTVSDFVPL